MTKRTSAPLSEATSPFGGLAAAAGHRPHEADGALAARVDLRVAHSVDAVAGLLGPPISLRFRARNSTLRFSVPVTVIVVLVV